MLILIDAELCAPPSEVTLFRDITLFSTFFLEKKVLIECTQNEKDFYYKWLRDKSSWDYVYDIIEPKTEVGISIRTKKANITIPRINYSNFSIVMNRLNKI